MRILFVTDHYPPEASAPAVRCSTHAKRWIARGHQVTMLTNFPNYPDGKVFGGYRQSLYKRETYETVDVLRVPTLVFPNRGAFLRILDYLSFVVTASLASPFVARPDVVIATSPHIFAAVAGWIVSRVHRRPFVFEVRDLWPDSIIAVGAMKEGRLMNLVRRVERFLYRHSDLIVTVTHTTRDVLASRGIDAGKIVVITNGADTTKLAPGCAPSSLREKLGVENKVVVSYIGTVGMAHGLQLILDAADECLTRVPEAQFIIVGSGAEREELQQQAERRGLRNVLFVGRVSHDETIDYWHLSDFTLVLLKNTPLFKTVLPSKVFEALATGTPIITNVRGELEQLLEPLGAAEMIEPDSVEALVSAIGELARDPARRRLLAANAATGGKRYERTALADSMLEALQRLCPGKPEESDRPDRGLAQDKTD
ncbi:glycosyltransferase family 4 protein [Bradyrhizobium japonicum]|uniref:glycosyltransferase family 4 protein n=1 Tax=Bradyrhizobium japonicum TaxID=375 RepID=UPI0005809309|nr:glycosyltransferase family 4 protein [Bradyrhizobium japonicum]MEB2673308.1 glycosyltransferase family 4 protein [Bradyrhizobium japonicum]WRI74243.1 glycosyltransferase family 4 protein [Bradyrhizobium japonicum]WRI83044.1 glycosyltransferase family 4 protein [Bradyrhizobium japonicum]WRI92525.1 glycosyltransferase family 4 protein [Bradyrhizobium japonicum]WRJ76992.1 glycosyltransferase family 4 protein [Bradyrhizobium japonicum]